MPQLRHAPIGCALRRIAPLAAIPLILIGLNGCAGNTPPSSAAASGTGSTTALPSTASSDDALMMSDMWAKAAASGNTAVFGRITNTGSNPVTITSGSSPNAARVELHEVVMKDGAMTMQPKPGGITIAPSATHVLAPGADHLMLLELRAEIAPGDQVQVTLTLSDGTTVPVQAIAKEFAAGNESYEPSSPGGMTSPSMNG